MHLVLSLTLEPAMGAALPSLVGITQRPDGTCCYGDKEREKDRQNVHFYTYKCSYSALPP